MTTNDYIESADRIKFTYYDLDGFVWVRDSEGNTCGPYESEAEARADFEGDA